MVDIGEWSWPWLVAFKPIRSPQLPAKHRKGEEKKVYNDENESKEKSHENCLSKMDDVTTKYDFSVTTTIGAAVFVLVTDGFP